MFIEQGQKGKQNIFLYIAGFIIIFGFTQLGSLPVAIHWGMLVSQGKVSPFTTKDQSELMFIIGQHINKNLLLFYLSVGFTIAFVALYFWMKYLHKRTLLSVITARKRFNWKRLMFAFSIEAVVVLGDFVYSYFSAPEELVWQFQLFPFLVLLVIAGIFLSIQPALEETLFRGYLLQGLAKSNYSRIIPILLTSLLFGFMHLANPEVAKHGYILALYYVGFGLFSACWCVMDDGLELSIGVHIANNLLSVLLVCSPESVLQTFSLFKSNAPIDVTTSIISFYITASLLTVIFALRYKWKNWKKLILPVENIIIESK